ncbi:MAG: cobalt-precorrin-5B (C(1))-methyltransferase [Alphaproteobacteria bacterium]
MPDKKFDTNSEKPEQSESTALKRGWTTGACATGATKAALTALLTGVFPDPVAVRLPKGQEPDFALATESLTDTPTGTWAEASIIKDAGDDPDVTHGARIVSRVSFGVAGSGVVWRAGEGVGTVTRVGLPIPVGEASITPVPRAMMLEVVQDLCAQHGKAADVVIELSIPNGEALAKETLNGRLGVLGGLSILGTTGIVIPYSCSSWIHSIHRGIDVSIAAGIKHTLASTGNTSETAANQMLNLPDTALLDMGDFAGGLLKYMAKHPVERLTIAGGIGKLSKLAQGHLDLHSKRSQVDPVWLKQLFPFIDPDKELNSAAELLLMDERDQIVQAIANLARDFAQKTVSDQTSVDVMVFDRKGKFLGKSV